MNRPRAIIVDVSEIAASEELHKLFAKTLKFPTYYGSNFNAFWDCITDEAQSTMPKKLIIKGVATLHNSLPIECNKLVECLDDYQEEYPEREVIFE